MRWGIAKAGNIASECVVSAEHHRSDLIRLCRAIGFPDEGDMGSDDDNSEG